MAKRKFHTKESNQLIETDVIISKKDIRIVIITTPYVEKLSRDMEDIKKTQIRRLD